MLKTTRRRSFAWRLAALVAVAVAFFTVQPARAQINMVPYNGSATLQAYPGTQTTDAMIAVTFNNQSGLFGSASAVNASWLTITGQASAWIQQDLTEYPTCSANSLGTGPLGSGITYCDLSLYAIVPAGTAPGNYGATATLNLSYTQPTSPLMPPMLYSQSIGVTIQVLPLPAGSGAAELSFAPAIATIAGTGSAGYSGNAGPATQAELNQPSDIAIDSSGNVYIADTQNYVIRRIDTTGKITVYAGTPQQGGPGSYSGEGGLATAARLEGPVALALDSSNNLYIADSPTSVRVVNATTGIITTYAGPVQYKYGYSGDGGLATNALLDTPNALAFDSNGNLYISEYFSNDVRVVTANGGTITTFAGQNTYLNGLAHIPGPPAYQGYSGDGGLATAATLFHPDGLAFIPGNGLNRPSNKLYIADGENDRVRTVDLTTGDISTVLGIGAWGTGTAAEVGAEGTPATTAAIYPQSLAFDSNGNAYILSINGLLFKVDATGNIYQYPSPSTSLLFSGNGDNAGVKVSPAGNVYIASAMNNAVYEIQTPGSLAFGDVNVGSTSAPQYLTVQNSGSGPLEFGSTPYTVNGAFVVGESGTCNFANPLPAGATCTVEISFAPQTVGAQSGTVSFISNDPASPLVANLTGTGDGLGISPTAINFGDQIVGFASEQPITLTAGGKAVNFIGQGIVVEGGNSSYFSSPNNCGSSLAAGAQCAIQATFTPTAPGAVSSSVSITSNLGGFQQSLVPLSGTAFLPTTVAVNPTALNFPTQVVGSASAVQKVQVTNTGSQPLAFFGAGITITGPNAGEYSQTNNCGTGLAVGDPPCTISVTFTPTLAGTANATLSIPDNVIGQPQLVTLTGTGATTVPINVVEAIMVSDSDQVYPPIAINVNESIHATDADTATPSIQFAIQETVHTVDAPFVTPSTLLLIPETVHTTDSDAITPSTLMTIAETVHTSDEQVVLKQPPAIAWPAPAAIGYGTPLSATQLDATDSLPGVFTYTPPAGSVLPAGMQTLSVTFSPNDTTDYTTAMKSMSLTVNQASLAVTAVNQSMTYGGTLPTLTGILTGVLPGDGITASYSTTATSVSPPGVYPITATLNDPNAKLANYIVANTPGKLTISQATPVVTLASSQNPSYALNTVTFTATVASPGAGTPSGTVTFFDGATSIGSGTLAAGALTFTTSTLSTGSHSITASYGGDANFAAATSSALTQSVVTFTVGTTSAAGATSTITVVPGGSATFDITISPMGVATFPAQIDMSVSGLPDGYTYTLSPSSISAGSGSTTVVLTIAVPADAAAIDPGKSFLRRIAPLTLALLLMPFLPGFRRPLRGIRRSGSRYLLVLLVLLGGAAGALTLNGCIHVQSKTYPIVFTASSGNAQQNFPINLIVE